MPRLDTNRTVVNAPLGSDRAAIKRIAAQRPATKDAGHFFLEAARSPRAIEIKRNAMIAELAPGVIRYKNLLTKKTVTKTIIAPVISIWIASFFTISPPC